MTDFHLIKNFIPDVYDSIEKNYYNRGKITGIHTGFYDLDSILGGMQNSNLIVVGGRPSMGKTAFILNIVENAALKYQTTTAIFSFEMSKEMLINRMLCSLAKTDSSKLRCGNLEYNDWQEIAQTIDKLTEAPIYVDDTVNLSVLELCEKCRKLKKEMPTLSLVVIDGFEQITKYSTSTDVKFYCSPTYILKELAKELDIVILMTCQLSRSLEQRNDKHPRLSDIKNSVLEQVADVVMLIYRNSYYYSDDDFDTKQAEIIIAKHRNGAIGSIDLQFDSSHVLFQDIVENCNSLI